MKYHFLILLFFLSLVVVSQNNNGNELQYNMLNKTSPIILNNTNLAIQYENKGDYSKALSCLRQELALSPSLSKASIINQIGRMYLYLSDFSKALLSFESALKITELQQDEKEKTKSNIYIGQLFTQQGDYSKATTYLFKALKMAESAKDSSLLSSNYNSLGNLYVNQFNDKEGLHYYSLALRFLVSQQLKEEIIILENIANIYANQGNFNEALQFYNKALTLSQKAKMDNLIASSLLNIGTLYLDLGDSKQAIDYLKKGLEMGKRFNEKIIIVGAYINLSDAYFVSNQNKLAEETLLSTLLLVKNYKLLKEEYMVEVLLTKLYEKNKDLRKEYKHLKKKFLIKDSLFSSETKKEIIKQEMLYEFEKKEIIRKAEEEKQDAQEKLKRTRNGLLFSFLVFCIVGTLFFLLRSQKLKNQKDKLLAENKQLLIERQNSILNAEKEELEGKLNQSKTELLNFTQNMIEKNELLEQFKIEVETLKNLKSKELYDDKIEKLDYLNKISILTEDDWFKFKELFDQVYKGFFTRLKEKFPALTQAEIRFCSLVKLNITANEMASILGVSASTIKTSRYRLRKKIGISEDINLPDLISSI